MVKFSYAAKKGSAYLSSLYGSYNSELPFAIPEHKVAGFRCPHCDADLKTDRKCDVCGSHMVALDLTQGGNVQFCSRKGCRKHLLEFSDFDTELEAFYKAYAHQLDA
jgi:methionyl-tRNA synthetase